ncbi:MAG: hypothetical protein R3185_00980 [Candidatus Thermoplasmatota archaeon]|nr:hypothetical protein [Candidatus Thermoplasmatota archaeon]
MAVEMDRLVRTLDEMPLPVDLLAKRLEAPEEDVREALGRAQAAGLASDWGDEVWATTWRAKWQLHPRFFGTWLPGSLAIGSALTAGAAWLNAGEAATQLSLGLVGVAVLAGAAAGWTAWKKKG